MHGRYLLSQHPEVEAKLLRELDALELLATDQRPHPRPVSPQDLGRLTFLQAIIKVWQRTTLATFLSVLHMLHQSSVA